MFTFCNNEENQMKRLISGIILRRIKQQQERLSENASAYSMMKEMRHILRKWRRIAKDIAFMTAGVLCAAMGLKGFLLANHFIDGGVTGLSLLFSALTQWPLSYFVVCINIPFVFLAYKLMGKTFAFKTVFSITGLALVLAFVPFQSITNDNLLIAVFGGFFLGAGIGLAMRGGAVLDGTEVLAIFLSKKLSVTIGDIVMIINIIIFLLAAYFLGIEIAMYSMITYLSASKTLDFIIEGIEEYIGVTIISNQNETIRQMIVNELGRGVTIYNGKGGYGKTGEKKEVDILYTIITRLELNKLNAEIERIAPNAFVVMHSVKDTKGGMIKKRPLKH